MWVVRAAGVVKEKVAWESEVEEGKEGGGGGRWRAARREA